MSGYECVFANVIFISNDNNNDNQTLFSSIICYCLYAGCVQTNKQTKIGMLTFEIGY